MSINRVALTGNLGAEPDLRRTQSGMAILNMRLAVNDRRKDPQTGDWSDYCNWVGVVVFGNRAESLSNMLHRGSKIGVDGKLRYSEWERDGNRRSKLEVIADDIELLTPKSQGGGYQQGQVSQPLNRQQESQGGVYQASTSNSGPVIDIEPAQSIYDSDIPF